VEPAAEDGGRAWGQPTVLEQRHHGASPERSEREDLRPGQPALRGRGGDHEGTFRSGEDAPEQRSVLWAEGLHVVDQHHTRPHGSAGVQSLTQRTAVGYPAG